MNFKPLSRRDFGKNIALAALLAPIIRFQKASAANEVIAPRVLLLFSPNGPVSISGPASADNAGKVTLHSFYSRLERHKADGNYMGFMPVPGQYFGDNNEYGHQSAGTGCYTGTATEGTNSATGPSLDQYLGAQLQARGISTPQRSLLWGLHEGGVGGWGPWYEAAGKPAQPTNNPFRVFQTLFQDFNDPSHSRLAAQKSILDSVYPDCVALSSSLGAEGKAILDAHCTNIRDLEAKFTKIIASGPPPASCKVPKDLQTTLLTTSNFNDPANYDLLVSTFADLLALAFACDISRVAAFSFAPTAARLAVPAAYHAPAAEKVDSGDEGAQHHAWTHSGKPMAEKTAALKTFYDFYSESVAVFIDKLKATKDATGQPLFNNTLIMWSSELGGYDGGTNGHNTLERPVLLFGNSQGAIKTGRVMPASVRDAKNSHAILVSLIQHMGLKDVQQFGNPKAGSGPLGWLYG